MLNGKLLLSLTIAINSDLKNMKRKLSKKYEKQKNNIFAEFLQPTMPILKRHGKLLMRH